MAVKKQNLMTTIQQLKDLLVGEVSGSDIVRNRFTRGIITTVRIFIASTNKFLADDCFTKASAIAYTTLVSMIPTLMVALTFIAWGIGDEGKDAMFKELKKILAEHNLQKLNIDPLIDVISGIIDNATKIGGVGAVVMIFSATAVLRTLDNSLNAIWKVSKKRHIVTQVIYYWAVLTLGPLLMISGTTLATQIYATFTKPNYASIAEAPDGNTWVVGSKASILHGAASDPQMASIDEGTIDFDNQKIYDFNPASNDFSEGADSFNNIDFGKNEFTDIAFSGNRIWVIGKRGILLSSTDAGKTWRLTRFGNINMNDIHMSDAQNGYIAADAGYLLTTTDGWETAGIKAWPDFNVNLNDIAFRGKKGIIACDKGYILTTEDGGVNWSVEQLNKSRFRSRFVNIHGVHLSENGANYLVGDEGVILIAAPGSADWVARSFKAYNYKAAMALGPNEALVAGENGTVIHTRDGGITWRRYNVSSAYINALYRSGSTIVAAGHSGTLMRADTSRWKWRGTHGTSFLVYMVNFFAPFIFIWMLFLFTYRVIPNIHVPFKAAASGAAFTGTVWVVFIYLFIVYAKAFANSTFAVYGALAAIPLFLLMIYSSTLILLFGAEVSYTLMNPETYRSLRISRKPDSRTRIFYGISLVHMVYARFEKKHSATSIKDIARELKISTEEASGFVELFVKNKVLALTDAGACLPQTTARNVQLTAIVDMLFDASLTIPDAEMKKDLAKYLAKRFDGMRKARAEILGGLTIADLVAI